MDTETYILTVYDDDGNPIGIPAIMGRGIEFIKRTSGDGSAGSTDVYTITYTDGTTSTYTVYNGVVYESLRNGNVWPPDVLPDAWTEAAG